MHSVFARTAIPSDLGIMVLGFSGITDDMFKLGTHTWLNYNDSPTLKCLKYGAHVGMIPFANHHSSDITVLHPELIPPCRFVYPESSGLGSKPQFSGHHLPEAKSIPGLLL